MKKTLFIDSIYTMEPNSTMNAWDNHWNYEWNGRNSLDFLVKTKWRRESENLYIVQDTNGVVWKMDKEAFEAFLKELPNIA